MELDVVGPQPVGAAARMLGVSAETLKKWADRGELPAGAFTLTLGGHRRFDVRAIREWMLARATLAVERGRKRERRSES
jgi:excisionase family DNA binding protein